MASGLSGNGGRHRFGAGRSRRTLDREPPPLSFGETLRQARRGRELTLEDAERETRIPLKYLAALEDQDYDPLPSSVYARGVLRAYATFLGLEPEPLLEQFRPPRARDERNPIRPAMSLTGAGSLVPWSTVGGLLLAVLVLVGVTALGVYLYGQYVALSDSLQAPEPRTARGGLGARRGGATAGAGDAGGESHRAQRDSHAAAERRGDRGGARGRAELGTGLVGRAAGLRRDRRAGHDAHLHGERLAADARGQRGRGAGGGERRAAGPPGGLGPGRRRELGPPLAVVS